MGLTSTFFEGTQEGNVFLGVVPECCRIRPGREEV